MIITYKLLPITLTNNLSSTNYNLEPRTYNHTSLGLFIRDRRVDFIVLAGYLRLLPTPLVAAYPRAVINIHPALLPAFGGRGFYGIKVHQAVIKSGAR